MKVGSLFSGVGGMDMGFVAAGMELAWMVEKDPRARAVLRYHFPDVPLFKDVRHVGADELTPVDVLIGGFPCTDLSVAGRREGLAGEASGLVFEFLRIASEISPRWLVFENVNGLLSSHGGRDMGTLLGEVGRRGFWWTYRRCDTQWWGPPQRRRRIFLVGHLGAPCPPEVLLEPESVPWADPPRRPSRQGSPGAPRVRAPEGGGGGDAGGRVGLTAGEVAPTIPASGAGTSRTGNERTEAELIVMQDREVSGAVSAKWAKGTGGPAGDEAYNLVAVPLLEVGCRTNPEKNGLKDGAGVGDPDDPMYSLQAGRPHGVMVFDPTQITHPANRSTVEPDGPCHTLPRDGHPPVAFKPSYFTRGEDGAPSEVCPPLSADADKGDQDPVVAAYNIYPSSGQGADLEASETEVANLGGRYAESERGTRIVTGSLRPRRLTPRECERLQGWPDDWTRWGKKPGGKVVEMSDTARYRMAGNGVSGPVAYWIARRIRILHEGGEV